MITELYDALRKAGVDEQLARDASRAVLGVDTMRDVATKADIAATKADIAATKADLRAEIADLRTEVAELRASVRADMAELKADLIKWNVGTMVALAGICVAIVRLT